MSEIGIAIGLLFIYIILGGLRLFTLGWQLIQAIKHPKKTTTEVIWLILTLLTGIVIIPYWIWKLILKIRGK